jgi:hypothetical protein
MEEKYRIHGFYIILILGSIIIILVTINWGAIPRLPELITFALTLTSLVLALLAIVYAYVSNSSLSRTINELTNVAKDIVSSAVDVRSATDGLKANISPIHEQLSHVGQQVEQTQALVREYSAKQIPQSERGPEKINISTELIDRFLNRTSINGLLCLYIVQRAFSQSVTINLNLLETQIDVNPKYLYGYIVACASVGILSCEGGIENLKINMVNEVLTKKIKPVIDNFGKTNKKVDIQTLIIDKIDKIDKIVLPNIEK